MTGLKERQVGGNSKDRVEDEDDTPAVERKRKRMSREQVEGLGDSLPFVKGLAFLKLLPLT